MDVFALWPVVFYKNILVFSNTRYFGKAYMSYVLLSYLSVSTTKYDFKAKTPKYAYLDIL